MNSKGRRGSAALMIALVVVIVLAVAGGIWYLMAHNNSLTQPSSQSTAPNESTTQATSSVSLANPPVNSPTSTSVSVPQQSSSSQPATRQSFSDSLGQYSITYPLAGFKLLQSSGNNPGGEIDGGLEIYSGTSTDFMQISYSFGTHGPQDDLAQLLPIIQNEAAQSGGSYSTSTVMIGGFEGVEISLTKTSDNTTMNVYVFGTGEDVYTITVYPTTSSNKVIAQEIIGSFKSSL